MNVKGLKVKDIMNIDLDTFNNLNESELRAITSRLVSASNKRIRRLKERDINSPAIRGLGEIPQFSTKLNEDVTPQNRVNQLRHTFAKIRNFMTSETSTISGYNKFVKRIKTKLAEDLGMTYEDVDKKLNVGKMFDLLHQAQKDGLISSYRHSKGSMQGREIVTEQIIENPELSYSELKEILKLNADIIYKKTEKEEQKKIEQEDIEDETEETEF